MIRVNKANPCKVCEKPDWCMYSEDGQVAICARISEGSRKKVGDAGYMHILEPGSEPRRKPLKRYTPKPARNFTPESNKYQSAINSGQIEKLSATLGVSSESLKRLNVGFDGEAFTFPMRDEKRRIVGIRRRFGDGRKFAVKGSTNALFIPDGLSESGPLLICEGPTDTAAALDLGFDAVGHPNCNSRVDMTVQFAHGRRITIIADNDAVGIEGAKILSKRLIECCPAVKIIVPPPRVKDLRQWKQRGLSKGWHNNGS